MGGTGLYLNACFGGLYLGLDVHLLGPAHVIYLWTPPAEMWHAHLAFPFMYSIAQECCATNRWLTPVTLVVLVQLQPR